MHKMQRIRNKYLAYLYMLDKIGYQNEVNDQCRAEWNSTIGE